MNKEYIDEEYEVIFTDGTRTLIIVSEDETPADVIAELCEAEGWPLDEVKAYCWTGKRFFYDD